MRASDPRGHSRGRRLPRPGPASFVALLAISADDGSREDGYTQLSAIRAIRIVAPEADGVSLQALREGRALPGKFGHCNDLLLDRDGS